MTATTVQAAVLPAQERAWVQAGFEVLSGFVVAADDVAWATTPEQLFRVHGLGFAGSPLRPDAPFIDVVRAPLTPFASLTAAIGGNDRATAQRMGGPFVEHPPFHGSGFVGEIEQQVPLWWLDPIRMPAGSQLRRIHADGRDELVAEYVNVALGWVPAAQHAAPRLGWQPISPVLGPFAVVDGDRVPADPMPDGSVVVCSTAPRDGWQPSDRGLWWTQVPAARAGELTALRVTATLRGVPVQVVQRGAGPEGEIAGVVSIAHDAPAAEAAGFGRTAAGVYEATVPWSELAELQAAELRAPVDGAASAGAEPAQPASAPPAPATPASASPASGVDAERVQQLQVAAAKALLRLVRDRAAERAELFWSTIDGASTGRVTLTIDGAPHRAHPPVGVIDAMPLLREALARPDRGAWLSANLTVDTAGAFAFSYDYDRRPYWNTSGSPYDPPADGTRIAPDDDAFAADLARHPRDPELVPEWYPTAPAATGSGVIAADLAARSLDVPALPDEFAELASVDAWRRIGERVRSATADEIASERTPGAFEDEALAQRLESAIIGSALDAAMELDDDALHDAVDAGVRAGLLPPAARGTRELRLEAIGDILGDIVVTRLEILVSDGDAEGDDEITEQAALGIARTALDEQQSRDGGDYRIFAGEFDVPPLVDHGDVWTINWNSREYLETGDHLKMLLVGPILVPKRGDGSFWVLGTAGGVDAQVARWRAQMQEERS
jgi:hypothetical protein